jgi:hypothetical protein
MLLRADKALLRAEFDAIENQLDRLDELLDAAARARDGARIDRIRRDAARLATRAAKVRLVFAAAVMLTFDHDKERMQ